MSDSPTTQIAMHADDRDFLREIAAGCHKLGVPVTVADIDKLCDKHGIDDPDFAAELLAIGNGEQP
ncbi:hypothetical protein [Gulosibacter bifidus]|uniref:Uncharacterized protein n=1 Tax=Gulosibacter bifidus TaxID=272239 RepID=A0ABW5RKC4_9MICO|nr:hypothetical protein [Gulosibacter bifidus]